MSVNVGMIVAIELDAVFSHYKNIKELPAPSGFKLYFVEKEEYNLYILKTGMGEIAAAAGVQHLVSGYGVSKIINFGVVGGLTPEMKKQKVCIVRRVVHYKYDCSEFLDLKVGQVDGHDSIFLETDSRLFGNALAADSTLMPVTCCSGDKFVATAEEKQYLHDTFEGDICDMESAGIVLASEINDIPCILLKAVSDGLAEGAAGFFAELQSASLKALEIADSLL